MYKYINSVQKRFLLPCILLVTILLSACGPSASANPSNTLYIIYTAAAQTVEAQYTEEAPTATDQIATPIPTDTVSDVFTPTSLPILELVTSTPFIASLEGTVCDDSSFISDVTIPDNTVVPAGQTFIKTWMLQNTGSCAWSANYTLTFINGDQMDGTDTSIEGSVEPGQQAELSVTLAAPTTAGQYTGYWQLANDSNQTFGVTVYVLIDVTEDATATPTVTLEKPTVSPTDIASTAVPTNKPTDVPTAVSTTAPTIVPTSVPTAVPTTTPTAVSTTAPTAIPTSSTPDN